MKFGFYKGEKIRIEDIIGKRAYIFIPSRQDYFWVKTSKIRKFYDIL